MRFWNDIFSKFQIVSWEFIVPEDIENKTFWIIFFWRKFIFQKLKFWVHFLLRNQISMINSHLKKNFWLSLLSKKNKFFIFCAYFRRHDLDATFFIKNQSFKWLFWKNESYSEANFFLQNEILKWHFFKVSDCELRIFHSGRFYNKKLFK